MLIFKKDLGIVFGIIAIAVVACYFLPRPIGNIVGFLLLLAFLFDYQRRNFIWLAAFLFFLSTPGELFASGINQLPSLNLAGYGREIFYRELIGFALIIKYILNRKPVILFYKKQIIIVILYSIFLFLLGWLYGMSIITVFKTIRYIFPLFLFLVIPGILKPEDNLRFLNLVFWFSILCFIMQVIDRISGHSFASLLGQAEILPEDDNELVRTFYGAFIMILTVPFAAVLQVQKRTVFSNKFLLVVLLISYLSAFLSATRGWILGFSLIMLTFLLLKQNYVRPLLGIGLIVFVILLSPIMTRQFTLSLNRVSSLEQLVKGDVTAGGTLQRINERSPRVMKKFNDHPLLGHGFSEDYYDYQDGHVGNQTLLLAGGAIGFIIYLIFLGHVMWVCIREGLKNNPLAYILLSSVGGIIIIHSSSRIIFNYLMSVDTAVGLSLFFYFVHFFIHQMPKKRT